MPEAPCFGRRRIEDRIISGKNGIVNSNLQLNSRIHF